MFCTDAAGAAAARKSADAVLAGLKDKLNVDPKASADKKKAVEASLGLLNAVKLSAAGDRIAAGFAVEPTTLARIFMYVNAPPDMEVPKAEPK